MIKYFLILFYVLIPYLPLFGEIDRIGSQSLILSGLNFIALAIMFLRKEEYSLFKLLNNKTILFYFFFLFSCFLSSINAINYSEFLIEIFRAITIFNTLLIFLSFFIEKKLTKYLMWIIFFTMIFDIIGLMAQYLQGLNMIGFTSNKNIAAFSLAIKLNFLFYFLYKQKSLFLKIIFVLIYLGGSFALLMINSKGAILIHITAIIYYICFGIFLYKNDKKFILNAIIVAFLFGSLNLISKKNNAINAVANTIVNFQADSGNTSRVKYYSQVIMSAKEKPLIGIGYGNWKIESIKYDSKEMRDYIVQYYSHNDFFQVLAETGFIGLFFYSSIFISIFLLILKKLNQETTKLNIYFPIFLLGCFFTYIFDALINFPGYRIVSQLNLIYIIYFTYSSSFNEK